MIPYGSDSLHGYVECEYFVAIFDASDGNDAGNSAGWYLQGFAAYFKLNESVKEYEAGEKPEIYTGGSMEIRHLGHSIQNSYEQIDRLMKEIVKEQDERRKSEMDALQSQINPHFLYNALESLTWMVEAEKNDEAVS